MTSIWWSRPINVQREVGGNLAEILDVISFTIRERVRIKGEIRTLTAQGRYSGYVISLLPIGLALVLFCVNKPYVERLFTIGFLRLGDGGVRLAHDWDRLYCHSEDCDD